MSKLNKLVTNYPVQLTNEEVENLSLTLSAVRTAGGGGGEGKTYHGEGFVSVNNTNNSISLTTEANEKLNQDIPTKVSDLSDSANYQTVAGAASTYQTIDAMSAYSTTEATTAYVNGVTGSIWYTNILGLVDALSAKQDKLTFGYDENDSISSINSHKLAGAGGVTGDYYSASNPSGFINSTQAETQILAKKYITSGVSELDNFYSKTDTSSKTELQTKFNSLLDYDVVTGNSAVLITTADADNTRTFTISLTATPTAADTVLNGQNGVDATLNGNVWNVGLSQSSYNAVNNVQDKLDTTAAAQTYQPIGNYLSSNALDGYATQQWVGQQGYLTEVPSEYVTDTELQTTLGDYATNALVQNTSATITALIPSTENLASETDLQIVSAGVDYVSAHAITAHQSLTDYYTKSQTSGAIELSTEFGKYALKSEIPTKVSDLTDSANYYKTTETSSNNELSTEFAKYLTKTQYNTDSATFALKTDLNDLVSSASVTTNDNYVMTNSGWKVLTLPGGGMTQVYHDTTLTGDGNANDNQLGVKWETLSSNTIAYSNSAFNLTNGTSVSSFDQISASIDSRYSKTASDGRYLQKSLDDTLTGDGTSNKKLGVAWSALSGNTIASAEKAGEAQGFRWGDNTYQDTSAALTNLWNSKNHVTLQSANNILTVDNNDNTSATLSAMSYVNNTLNNRAFLPQKACVCLESEITTMATLSNGQGMLFFVVSAHQE